MRVLLASWLLWVLAGPAHAILIPGQGGTAGSMTVEDPEGGRQRVNVPGARLRGATYSESVESGGTSALTAWTNTPTEFTITFVLSRVGGPQTTNNFSSVSGYVPMRFLEAMAYELDAVMLVSDSGQGDQVVFDLRLEQLEPRREPLFRGFKESTATPNERFTYGLVGGDTRDTEEGSRSGVFLPWEFLPGPFPGPDRIYTLAYTATLANTRDDPGDTGATAWGRIVLRVTPTEVERTTDLRVTKRDRLIDEDGDGRAGPGELIEYTILTRNVGDSDAEGVRIEDVIDVNAELVRGSVESTLGSVVRGNLTGDESVEVEVGTLPRRFGDVTTFRARVEDSLPEGVLGIRNRARVTGDNFPEARSDDPDTGSFNDDTVTALANTALDRCERSSVELEEEVLVCEDDLASVLADDDADGVLDLLDRCPSTSPGAPVDALGCSQAEFCAAVTRRLACDFSDWKNDEVFLAWDCRFEAGVCSPRGP